MQTKGQGISVNMIILIVLGLIVLVIAALMIGKSSKLFSDKATECVADGGICRAPGEEKTSEEAISSACPSGKICYRFKNE